MPRLSMTADEVLKERVRTSGVVRRVGERQNVFIAPYRETFLCAKGGIGQLLTQTLSEIGPPFHIAGEGKA